MSDDRGEPVSLEPHTAWYHGSPLRLDVVRAGATVTPVVALARVFAHKPSRVSITMHETDEVRTVTLEHDGRRPGYLYRVLVEDPAADLEQHPTSRMALGEEVLASRYLPLELIEELPVHSAEQVWVDGHQVTMIRRGQGDDGVADRRS